jgi:arylsulfatase A-like enzyme
VTGPGNRPFPVAREVVEPALDFLRRQSSRRFFLYVHVVDPHADYFTESPYHEMFGGAPAGPSSADREELLLAYDRAIRQADDQFARIATVLKEKGWWRGATVIYTSDHGEEFGEHGSRAHGYTLFEEQLRIPLIVKYPGGWEAPRRRHDLVTLADVMPTLADLCALSQKDGWIGATLRTPLADHALYFTEDLDHARLYAIRQGSQKVIVQLYPDLRMTLFDLAKDPGESSGRVLEGAELPGELRSLAAVLERWRARDLRSQPGVHLEKAATGLVAIDLEANLSGNARPFLTPRDLLSLAPGVRNGRLVLKRELRDGEPFDLVLAANDQGVAPPYRLSVSRAGHTASKGDAPVQATTVTRPVLAGPASDDVLRNLRSLGYLAGPVR